MVVTTFQLFKRMMDQLLLKGLRDGRLQRQIGNNFSICVAFLCTICHILPSCRILKRKLNVCKIKGRHNINTVYHITVIDMKVMSRRDIANALADNVTRNSSSAFSTFVCKTAKKQTIIFVSDNSTYVIYNRTFSNIL